MGAGLSRRCWNTIGRCAGAVAGLTLAVLLAGGVHTPAQAQNKLSDKSVQVLMEHAWKQLPPQVTTREGVTIVVDKTKRDQVVVPAETGREVIMVARMSAHAQLCSLVEEQKANYDTLRRRELAKKTWSDQQMLYIHWLHITVVQWLTGTLTLRDTQDGTVVSQQRPVTTGPCSEADKQRIKDQITAYINAAPASPASKTAEPVKTGTQKK